MAFEIFPATAEDIMGLLSSEELKVVAWMHTQLSSLRSMQAEGVPDANRGKVDAMIASLVSEMSKESHRRVVLSVLEGIETASAADAHPRQPTDADLAEFGERISHPLVWETGSPMQVLRHLWPHRREGLPFGFIHKALDTLNSYEGPLEASTESAAGAVADALAAALKLPEDMVSVRLGRPFRKEAPSWMTDAYDDLVKFASELPEGSLLVNATFTCKGVPDCGTPRAGTVPLSKAYIGTRRADGSDPPVFLADLDEPTLEPSTADELIFSAWCVVRSADGDDTVGGAGGSGKGVGLVAASGAVKRLGTAYCRDSSKGATFNLFQIAKARTKYEGDGEKLAEFARELCNIRDTWERDGRVLALYRES